MAGGLRHRPQAVEGRHHDHAVLHLLRGRGAHAGGAGRGSGLVSVLRTARAVAWSFLGIRRRSGLEEDMKQLNPLHVIAVALVGVGILVGALVALVHWVV
ncbi:MAG: DUF2970 domain-containing protein [Comamonadaceae bacterium]|nr:MAG: DUF2970 domain-containing protein [Comamonadaceae bacterium]